MTSLLADHSCDVSRELFILVFQLVLIPEKAQVHDLIASSLKRLYSENCLFRERFSNASY
jgi:hypothetical protein